MDTPITDWTLLAGYPDGALRLVVFPGGALIARSATSLYRSDDVGATWLALANPPGGRAIAADPLDTQVLYGIGPAGHLRSADGGVTWQLIRPAPVGSTPSTVFTVGPADSRELILAEKETILRSADFGTTWGPIYTISHAGSPCVASLTLLIPHPVDPGRLVTDAGCYAGRNFGTALSQTSTAGTTWSSFFPDGRSLYPHGLAGGQGVQPSLWYLIGDAFMGIGGGSAYRSDDDGASWSLVLRAEDSAPALGGLAYDPQQPDNVWVATGQTMDPNVTGVRASSDGGQTWSYLGRQDIGWVNDLVLAADGSALFAATNEGIWWYPFSA